MKDKLKIGIIGLGQRGAAYGMTDGSIGLLGNVLKNCDDAVITVVCDTDSERVDAAAKIVTDGGFAEPKKFYDYKDALKADLDAVIVATSWAVHVRVAVAAMEAGIPVAIEVGGSHDINECYELVDVYEKTRTPLFFMENCCFNKAEALATSLVRNGALGEVSYCQGYYCHDLRDEIAGGIDTGHYRLKEYTEKNCENYPTHELGPIAKILGINAGNRFARLVSMSSKAQGMKEYIAKTPAFAERLANNEFRQGDVTTTMIRCERGETIFIKLDTTLPRPYERGLTVSGTRGFFSQTTETVVLDDENYSHERRYADVFGNQKDYDEYLPVEWRTITDEQIKSGHGGMDFIMLGKFFRCVKDKLPMPVDVYDAAALMSITALSEISIDGGSVPVECPDFTRGKYRERAVTDVFDYPKIRK